MKTHRFFSVFLLLILAVSLLTGPASAAEVPDPAIQAKAALLVDANTGRMVYGKNEHEELYPASLTKIMTALLTLEAVDSGQLSMAQSLLRRAPWRGWRRMAAPPASGPGRC